MGKFTRRDALASATALGAVVLAGCVAEEDEPDGTDGTTGSPADRATRNDTDDGPTDTTEPKDTETSDDAEDTDGDDNDGGGQGADTEGQDDDTEDDEYDSSQGETDDERDSEESDGGGDTVEGQEVVLDYSVETTKTGCTAGSIGTGRGELVSQTEGTVTAEGSVVTSTPCHRAVIDGVSYSDGELALVVDVESTLGPDELCVQCIGQITYEATISVAEGVAVDSVSVTPVDQLPSSG